MSHVRATSNSLLFITLDSCRYDTFQGSLTPRMDEVGPLHRAYAPGTFTYGSHAAMFVGFTPGVAGIRRPYLNPKYMKIFRVSGSPDVKPGRFNLDGRNIVEGFRKAGYFSVGTGAVRWFDPGTPTGRQLTEDFHEFYYSENTFSVQTQVDFLLSRALVRPAEPVFFFLNVGETHVPYYHEGAKWSKHDNPCIPFSDTNRSAECQLRQKACLEFIDGRLAPLLHLFRDANILICADHGDAWGEGGIWEHGVHHPKVLEVPLIFRLNHPG